MIDHVLIKPLEKRSTSEGGVLFYIFEVKNSTWRNITGFIKRETLCQGIAISISTDPNWELG